MKTKRVLTMVAVMLAALIVSSCASTNLINYQFDGKEVNAEHPKSHINLLTGFAEGYERICLNLDNKRVGSFSLSGKLPGWGGLNFETHNEYWIDDLRITHYQSYVVEKQE